MCIQEHDFLLPARLRRGSQIGNTVSGSFYVQMGMSRAVSGCLKPQTAIKGR